MLFVGQQLQMKGDYRFRCILNVSKNIKRLSRLSEKPLRIVFEFGLLDFLTAYAIREMHNYTAVSYTHLHKRSIAILAGMCTAHIWIDRVTAYRQTRLTHDVLCFHLTNEDSIYYFCHDFCTSNILLNSSGIS